MPKLYKLIGIASVISLIVGGCSDKEDSSPSTAQVASASPGSSAPSESKCTTVADVDDIDYLKFNDIMYYAWSESSNDAAIDVNALIGDPVGEVGYTMNGNACLGQAPENGDAAYLNKGTKIYAMKGYRPGFRVIAFGRIYQVNENPRASHIEDVLDISGKVKSIVEEDRSNGQTIRELSRVNAEMFVNKALALDYIAPGKLTLVPSQEDRLFRILLTDGTSVRFEYYPLSDALSFGAAATTEIEALLTGRPDFIEPIANQSSAESPDGKFVIETYGVNKGVTAAGLYPVEGIRLKDKASDKLIWSMPGYYEQEFNWSPNSRYVSVYHEARVWGDTVIVDTKDGAEISLPGMMDVVEQWRGETTISDNRSDPYFKIADWVDDTRVNVTFTWIGQQYETFYGNYIYDLAERTIIELNVHDSPEGAAPPTQQLVSALIDRDIYLYGTDNGVDLHVGDRVYKYDWIYTTPRQIMPIMETWDYDKDGKDELFVDLNIGSGTGVALDAMHIVEINDDPVKDIVFQEDDYLKQLEHAAIGFRTTMESGELFGEIKIGNTTDKVSLKEYQSDETRFIQNKISFSSIVGFDSENHRLKARFGVGVFTEQYPAPMFIGYVHADIAYKAGKFTMSNFTFARDE